MYRADGTKQSIAFLQFVNSNNNFNSKYKLMPLGEHQATIETIIDGDTMHVVTAKEEHFVIRLAGIDAPEHNQPYGIEARDFLIRYRQFFVNIIVTNHDKYGRSVAYVSYNDEELNEELVVRGLAWVFKKYQFPEHYPALEAHAKQNRLGLWAQENPIAPWDFRHQKV